MTALVHEGRETSTGALQRLVSRAATLEERRHAAPASPGDVARAEAWRQFVARGDATRWARRLRFDGIDPATVPALLGDGAPVDQDGARAWYGVLREALAEGRRRADRAPRARARDAATEPAQPLPFEELLLPFVIVARRALRERRPALQRDVAPAARAQLERALLVRLATIAAPVLQQAFEAAGGGTPGGGRPSRALHARFVQDQLGGGLELLLERHAALARLLGVRVTLWTDAAAELHEQLEHDRDALAAHFDDGRALGAVTDLRAELSDSHNGGRMVSVLRFSSGVRIVHKPRSLAPERAFELFAAWANADRGAQPELAALRVLDRGTYGWMEYAEPTPCDRSGEAAAFFRRAGMLSCAMYLLGGKDLHSGNVLARDGHPLLIDLEMIAQPSLDDEGIGDASAVGSWRLVHGSVLSTQLIPLLCQGPFGGTFSEGGLMRTTAGAEAVVRRWRDVGTDAMACYREPVAVEAGVNVPADAEDDLARQHDEIARGFRDFYRMLRRRRTELLAADGPLAPFEHLHARLLLRSTDVYVGLQRRSLRPAALATGADRSIDFDALRRALLGRPDRHRLWEAVRHEVAALEMGDVPIFHVNSSDTALLAAGQVVVPGYSATSGIARIRERVRRLGPADLSRQLHFLRIAWTGYASRASADERGAPRLVTREGGTASREVAALAISDQLLRTAIPASAGGGTSWMRLGDEGLVETDASFANGRTGIAFFLAALHRVTGADVRACAMAAIAPLLHPGAASATRRTHGIGGARGLGGIVYGLVRIGQWLEEPAVTAAAVRIARAITPARIRADRRLDLFDGAAGALLGLLALHEATGDAEPLAQARECARHLVARRSADPITGLRVWRTLGDEHTGGFAHGASGIAHALGRLRRHGAGEALDARIGEALEAARAFEESLFVPAAGNWASSHAGARSAAAGQAPICGWCHGAAGIGLARLAEEDRSGEGMQRDIGRALDAVRAHQERPAPQDHLCCGNAGRIELLHYAGRQLARADLAAMGVQCADAIVERARARRVWGAGSVDDHFAPTLFFGVAGIGYQLLRLDHAALLPSALLWE